MNTKNILVIDDNADLLEMFSIVLTEFGYRVTTRSIGKDALDFVAQVQPSLVILDMMLDGYDGRDICNSLKQQQTVKDIPVLIISAGYQLENYLSGYCRPDGFLERPLTSIRLPWLSKHNWQRQDKHSLLPRAAFT